MIDMNVGAKAAPLLEQIDIDTFDFLSGRDQTFAVLDAWLDHWLYAEGLLAESESPAVLAPYVDRALWQYAIWRRYLEPVLVCDLVVEYRGSVGHPTNISDDRPHDKLAAQVVVVPAGELELASRLLFGGGRRVAHTAAALRFYPGLATRWALLAATDVLVRQLPAAILDVAVALVPSMTFGRALESAVLLAADTDSAFVDVPGVLAAAQAAAESLPKFGLVYPRKISPPAIVDMYELGSTRQAEAWVLAYRQTFSSRRFDGVCQVTRLG